MSLGSRGLALVLGASLAGGALTMGCDGRRVPAFDPPERDAGVMSDVGASLIGTRDAAVGVVEEDEGIDAGVDAEGVDFGVVDAVVDAGGDDGGVDVDDDVCEPAFPVSVEGDVCNLNVDFNDADAVRAYFRVIFDGMLGSCYDRDLMSVRGEMECFTTLVRDMFLFHVQTSIGEGFHDYMVDIFNGDDCLDVDAIYNLLIADGFEFFGDSPVLGRRNAFRKPYFVEGEDWAFLTVYVANRGDEYGGIRVTIFPEVDDPRVIEGIWLTFEADQDGRIRLVRIFGSDGAGFRLKAEGETESCHTGLFKERAAEFSSIGGCNEGPGVNVVSGVSNCVVCDE